MGPTQHGAEPIEFGAAFWRRAIFGLYFRMTGQNHVLAKKIGKNWKMQGICTFWSRAY